VSWEDVEVGEAVVVDLHEEEEDPLGDSRVTRPPGTQPYLAGDQDGTRLPTRLDLHGDREGPVPTGTAEETLGDNRGTRPPGTQPYLAGDQDGTRLPTKLDLHGDSEGTVATGPEEEETLGDNRGMRLPIT